MALRYTYILVV